MRRSARPMAAAGVAIAFPTHGPATMATAGTASPLATGMAGPAQSAVPTAGSVPQPLTGYSKDGDLSVKDGLTGNWTLEANGVNAATLTCDNKNRAADRAPAGLR